MVRGDWSKMSGDGEIWKKVGIAALCLNLVIAAPLALGLIVEDLEEESKKMTANEPEGPLKGFDDPSSLFSTGIGATLLFFATLLLYVFPTVLTLFSYFQIYTWFNSEIVTVKFVSGIITLCILAAGLTLQLLVGAMFPVSLAQYARGKDLKPALSPMGNASTVMQMGSDYWKKAAGFSVSLIVMTMVLFQGMNFFISFALFMGLMGGSFLSTAIAARHAMAELCFNM